MKKFEPGRIGWDNRSDDLTDLVTLREALRFDLGWCLRFGRGFLDVFSRLAFDCLELVAFRFWGMVNECTQALDLVTEL